MPERPDITQGRNRFVTRMLGLMDGAIETNSRLFDDDGGYVPATGRVDLMYVEAYRDLTIGQLGSMCRQTAVGTLTNTRKGLYTVAENGNLTLVARTALQTAAVYNAVNTEFVAALNTTGGFPATYRMESGRLYAFGHYISWTVSGPALKSYGSNSPAATLARAPRVAGGMAAQVDLPTSIPAGSVAAATAGVSMFAIA